MDLQQYRDRTTVDQTSWTANDALQDARMAVIPSGDNETEASVIGSVAGRATRNWRDIVSWESAAELKLETITTDWKHHNHGSIDQHHNAIGAILDELVQRYFDAPLATPEELEFRFRSLGCHALAAWREFTDATLDSLVSWTLRTLALKQHDYGHGNITKFGVRGIIVRTTDKYERLLNLQRRSGRYAVEPIEDTYLDLLGYSTIALMLIDDVFNLPLEKDCK
ncbi:MAG: DUF1599 domain-containing protein [Alphaproteobacteria bacterium]|nr:DUF1599 domain-containing protein [Alphaproteobacteria bacterium]